MTPETSRKPLASLLAAGILAAGSAGLLAGCGGDDARAEPPPTLTLGPIGTDFWDVWGAPRDARPGDIRYVQKRNDAPTGSQGWNVVYASEIAPGQMKWVSGEIYFPDDGNAAARDVVLWNHETTGVADACAPSRRSVSEERIPALTKLLAQGHVVVMSDYPGQGLPGPAYYMAGQPNARASLDMLRVAQRFPDAKATKNFVMYGWSQGGQTTMWAEAIAATYAPEFTGKGAALIAPGVRIRELTLNSMKVKSNAGYVISTLPGIKAYFPNLKYGDFLTTEGLEQFPAMADGCFDIWSSASRVQDPYQPNALVQGSPWWDAMTAADNFTPQGTMPFVIHQGTQDVDVPDTLTRKEHAALCKAGSPAEYVEYAGDDHMQVVPKAAEQLPAWFKDRFDGKAAPSNCS